MFLSVHEQNERVEQIATALSEVCNILQQYQWFSTLEEWTSSMIVILSTDIIHLREKRRLRSPFTHVVSLSSFNEWGLAIVQWELKIKVNIVVWKLVIGNEDNLDNLYGVLEKAMATHSSTLAWKIPWMEEPGRLQSIGSHRVRHDWSDLAAAVGAAAAYGVYAYI